VNIDSPALDAVRLPPVALKYDRAIAECRQ